MVSKCTDMIPKAGIEPVNGVSYHLQQALRGPLAVGWEKEGVLATTSLEFDYLY